MDRETWRCIINAINDSAQIIISSNPLNSIIVWFFGVNKNPQLLGREITFELEEFCDQLLKLASWHGAWNILNCITRDLSKLFFFINTFCYDLLTGTINTRYVVAVCILGSIDRSDKVYKQLRFDVVFLIWVD